MQPTAEPLSPAVIAIDEDVLVGDVVEVEFATTQLLPAAHQFQRETSIYSTPEPAVAPRRLSVDKQRPADAFRPPIGSNSADDKDEDGSASTSTDSEPDDSEKVAAIATASADADEIEETEEEEEGYVPAVDEAYDPYLFIRRLLPLVGRESPPGVPCNVLGPKMPHAPRVTLVLDLDETLLHASTEGARNPDVLFPVTWNGVDYRVAATKRPYLDEFMMEVSALFEVVVFTASQRVYASKLLDVLDPTYRWFHHRLYRDSCVFVEGNYLKDLSVLGRDLATTVIVDNSPQAFGLQYNNGIPILSWFDDENDTELLKLLPFLRRLASAKDVRPLLRARYKLYRRIEGEMMSSHS